MERAEALESLHRTLAALGMRELAERARADSLCTLPEFHEKAHLHEGGASPRTSASPAAASSAPTT